MKRSELVVGKAYSNNSKRKWYQERTISALDGGLVSYDITGGRNQGGKGKITIAGFAQWAERKV